MSNQIYKCKVCGGDLGWTPEVQKWKCKFCDSEFTLEDFEEQGKTTLNENYQKGKDALEAGYTEATDDTNVNPEDLRVYKCTYCSSEIVTDKTTAATTCVFCGNPVVIEEQLATDFKPEYVIPFKIKPDDVEEIYMKYISNKPFVPKSFLSKTHIEKIKGVYVPFWLYDYDANGSITADCEKTRHYSSGDYDCVEHNVYYVSRDGDVQFSNIPVDASSKTPDDAMDSIEPFNYDELVKFEMPYLAGFLAERYDQTKEDCTKRADVRVKNSMEDLLKDTITGYNSTKITSKNINAKNTKVSYAMLPTYMLFTNYNGKQAMFAVNGQTGKACGNTPIDKKRVSLFVLTRFLMTWGIGTILMLIIYLFG